ncbi:MAG: hypothetical protein GX757_02155 [Clostridiales bacterium]|nr:hypothetical protein [Clostridiales bacterium]
MKSRHTNSEELRALMQMLKKLNSAQKEELLKQIRKLLKNNANDGTGNKLRGR